MILANDKSEDSPFISPMTHKLRQRARLKISIRMPDSGTSIGLSWGILMPISRYPGLQQSCHPGLFTFDLSQGQRSISHHKTQSIFTQYADEYLPKEHSEIT